MMKLQVFCCLLLVYIQPNIAQGWPQQTDLFVEVGDTVKLPCQVNTEKCGDVHSIKWYRGPTRIFVFSDTAKISKAEGSYVDRTTLFYNRNNTDSYLKVKDTEVGDEALYKCEITYLEVREGCQVVQFLNLTTLIKPEYMKITGEEGSEILNSTVIGPITEDEEMTLVCESGAGKPIPFIEWWNGTTLMHGDYQTEPISDGKGIGRNRIRITITRGDLGARYECRVLSKALPVPFKSWLLVEVNVRPKRLEMHGVRDHVIQGDEVHLKCEVRGARPAANVTWFNGTAPMPADYVTSQTHVQADGTFDTLSELSFTATRFENEHSLTCEASNEIMNQRQERPMRETTTLQVMYPPLVTVKPLNTTYNETSNALLFCQYEANPATLSSVKWLKDGEEIPQDPDHYEGGNTDHTSLMIKNTTRYDHGNYTCVLENKVGVSESQNAVILSVHYPPTVNVTMVPSNAVAEATRENITLICEVVSGRPEALSSVRWYLDGLLLKELPDCSIPNSTFCDVDPAKLLLEEVVRSFHGNYSCMGENEAGWGPLSQDTPLMVYYAPSGVKLSYSPQRVVKRASVNLTCSVEDAGRPDNTTYRWTRGNQVLTEITSPIYNIDPVTLQTESNFTCTAINLGGESVSSTVYIKVYAPPTFIERLPPYYGALMTASMINVTCRVECSPLCSISWQKNGHKLDTDGPRYSVVNTVVPPDPRTNDFESVQSTLVWNMTAWPGGQLDRHTDNANYTCISTGNAVGSGVRSTTFFSVEYPPENLTVSNKVVNVIEGNVPEKVVCHAKAYPEASYQWRREGETDVIIKGNALILNYAVPRRNGGNYICEASNRHGNNTQVTYINVLYKPECGITQTEIDGKLVLICTAHANPTEVDFTWKIKNENETIEENIEKNGLQSFLTLETRIENFRTYLCYANNSVGVSIPCERDVTGNVAWWMRVENENLMIFIAIISGIILMVLIICIIIIIVCRRKRSSDKCPNPSANPDKTDLNSSPNDALLQPDSDRAFYENLPFHGIQNPPNKELVTVSPESEGEKATSTLSRPPSELSQYAASSGYGSQRSQAGASSMDIAQEVKPPAASSTPVKKPKKFHTIRHHSPFSRGKPQFRSLRASLRKKCAAMLPIKEDSPDHKRETNNNTPPVPAPRKLSPAVPKSPIKHTYQNLPVPIEPNTVQKTEPEEKDQSSSQYQPLKERDGSSRRKSRSRSAQGDSQQCIVGPNNYMSYYRDLPSPPPPPTYNGVYHRPRNFSQPPPLYHNSQRTKSDYAVKFHDVGQEIDV